MTTRERLQILQDECDGLAEDFEGMKTQMQRVRGLLFYELKRQREEALSEVLASASGEWCGIVYSPDARERLFERIDEFSSVALEATPKADQDAPIYLFLGEQGRQKMERYLNGEIDETTLSRIN